jgi:hypothetical protein
MKMSSALVLATTAPVASGSLFGALFGSGSRGAGDTSLNDNLIGDWCGSLTNHMQPKDTSPFTCLHACNQTMRIEPGAMNNPIAMTKAMYPQTGDCEFETAPEYTFKMTLSCALSDSTCILYDGEYNGNVIIRRGHSGYGHSDVYLQYISSKNAQGDHWAKMPDESNQDECKADPGGYQCGSWQALTINEQHNRTGIQLQIATPHPGLMADLSVATQCGFPSWPFDGRKFLVSNLTQSGDCNLAPTPWLPYAWRVVLIVVPSLLAAFCIPFGCYWYYIYRLRKQFSSKEGMGRLADSDFYHRANNRVAEDRGEGADDDEDDYGHSPHREPLLGAGDIGGGGGNPLSAAAGGGGGGGHRPTHKLFEAIFEDGPLGMHFIESADALNMEVTGVGGQSEANGVRLHDLIVAINGDIVTGYSQDKTLAVFRSAPRPMTVRFLRPVREGEQDPDDSEDDEWRDGPGEGVVGGGGGQASPGLGGGGGGAPVTAAAAAAAAVAASGESDDDGDDMV